MNWKKEKKRSLFNQHCAVTTVENIVLLARMTKVKKIQHLAEADVSIRAQSDANSYSCYILF